MKNVDLHMHTVHSDGLLQVEEIIAKAKENNLFAISITDHDTVSGYKDLDIKNQGIEILPGTELLSNAGGCSIHVLCYGFDYDKMSDFIEKNCPTRIDESKIKAKRVIKHLKNLGIDFDFDVDGYDYTIPGAWIFREFLAELIKNPKAYQMLVEENPDFVTNDRPFTRKGLDNIHSKFFVDMSDVCASLKQIREFCDKNHTLMFLAHPYEYGDNAEYILNIAKDYVDGIEVFHPTADEKKRQHLLAFAKEHNLMVCGGSDFHGFRGQINSEKVSKEIYDKIIDKLSKLH